MRVLVTGGLGHIGSKLIREYAERDDVELIRIIDNLSTQRYCSLFNLSPAKYQFIDGDISNKKDLENAMKDIDVVIHLAAITDAPLTIKNPKETFKVNYDYVKNVLETALNSNVKKFLFPSTTSVYGEAIGLVDENSSNEVYKPATPYAESKLKAEKLVQDYSKKGLNTTVLRMGTIFGTSIGMRFHTAVNKFCYLAVLKKPLTVWENALNQKRPYLGLYDCIRAFIFLEKNGKPGDLYNVVSGNFTVQEVVDAIKKFREVEIELTKSPILNQKSYEVSNKKIMNLGFNFKDSLSGGVKATLNYFSGIKN